MTTDPYLGMRPGDLDDKPYARYWNPQMRPLSEPVRAALLHGIEAAELGFALSEADRLLEPGYLPLENGFTRLANGEIFVAALTPMPGVTSRMIDWWFGWHYMESQRYKLWHPRAHLKNGAEKMIGDEPSLSDREKYLHNPNFVTEYVGESLLDITITFSEASDFLDASRFAAAGIGTAICGIVRLQKVPVKIGTLIHLIRETDDGCEMRSRFWLGQVEVEGDRGGRLLNPLAGSRFFKRRAAPDELGRNMLVHCAAEMSHLASFLPALYADYHPGR